MPAQNEARENASPPPSPDMLPIGPFWPKQSLFYGSTICVEWNGGGGEFDQQQNILKIEDIDVAIGQTQAESMAALISSELFEANPNHASRRALEENLAAFGLGVLNEIEQPDGDIALDQVVHRQTFMSIQGGVISENRPTEDAGVIDMVEIAAPNYYESKDISLLLSNTHRSTRHAEDGLYTQHNLLNCRLTDSAYFTPNNSNQDPVLAAISGLIENLNPNSCTIESVLSHGGVPRDIAALAEEVFYLSIIGIDTVDIGTKLNSSTIAQEFRQVIENFSNGKQQSFSLSGLPSSESPLWLWVLLNCALLRSPFAINTWSQAWVPLFLDYKVDIYPVDVNNWTLGEIDFEIDEQVLNDLRTQIDAGMGHPTFSGRAAVFGKSGAILSEQINRFISELGDATPAGMQSLADQMQVLDVVSVAIQDDSSILHGLSESMLASGILDLVEIEIIDAFGQTITLSKSGQDILEPTVALSLETAQDDRYSLLKPRFSTPARLNFTLLDGSGNDNSRADTQVTPVAGYLLPDHIDWAVEVFDAEGGATGQLRVAERDWSLGGFQSGRLMWDSAPGAENPLGSPASIGNPHMDSMLGELIRISLDDEVALQENLRDDDPNNDAPEGAFSALLRSIDTSLQTVDPLGKTAEDLPSLFAGRPVAVVRAELSLEFEDVQQVTNPDEIFEIRLGAMERATDGLLGYFINDDYTNFFAVLSEDVATSHHSGKGIEHDYLTFDPTIDIRMGQKIKLTLLMDPQSAVHVTSGFLPQKEITLLREHKQAALSKLAPTYSFGPLLVDSSSVRMPAPDMMQPVSWSWISRPTTADWSEDAIIDDDGKPHLPKGRATAWCGWLKMDPIEQVPFDANSYQNEASSVPSKGSNVNEINENR